MPRKTDSNNPADWIWFCESDWEALRALGERELGYVLCRSKLAEVIEKLLKAELIRLDWKLEKTHDLRKLGTYLDDRDSDLQTSYAPLVNTFAEVYAIARYPGFDVEEDADWAELRSHIAQVGGLLRQVKARIG